MDVRYLDNHLLVVNKPAGLLAQADVTGDPDLLTLGKAYLKERFNKPGNVFLGLVHRLDRPVSGVMVLARTSKAAARLTEQFRKRTVTKRYMALVEGRLNGMGDWTDYMLKDDKGPRIVTENHPKAKKARLRWRALAQDQQTTLVDIELFTGRAHQIRLQFARRGHALLGDIRHGAAQPFDGRNLALHSYFLSFKHPTQDKIIAQRQAPPSSWLGFHDDAVAALLETDQ